MITFNYEETTDNFYERILDLVIDKDTDLNFSVDHAPSFLCLAIQHCSIKLFNFLLSKNVDINFIGDDFVGMTEEEFLIDTEYSHEPRYSTCLDYACLRYDDKMYVFNIEFEDKPDFTKLRGYEKHKDSYEGDITISQNEYHHLLRKSKFLVDYMELAKLIILIGDKGGRDYNDLMGDKIQDKIEK